MTNRILITIKQIEFNQLCLAVEKINQLTVKPGCAVGLADEKHQDPDFVTVIILFTYYPVLFELAKIFGIILEKVNPQSL